MTSSASLLSFNQTRTHVVHYDYARAMSRYISLLDDVITPFKIHLSDIQQIEPYYHSDILFVRTLSGLSVWNVTNGRVVMDYPVLELREILVSKKYIVLCTNSDIQLLYASTLSLFQAFPIQCSYRVGSSAVEYFENRTVFAYSERGKCTICRENTLVTMQVFHTEIIAIHIHCAHDTIIIACAEHIHIFCLSSLSLIRKTENKIDYIHVCSQSKEMCYCSNRAGKTQCISLQKDKSDIFIDHADGVYLHSHGVLRNISNEGLVMRRICVE